MSIVRDDIHRVAPVAPHWKRLIRACENDADWAEEGRSVAMRVAVEEIRKGLDPTFLADLARQSKSPGLFVRDAVEELCRRQTDPFTSRMAVYMRGEAASGCRLEMAISHAIESATRGCFEAQLRNIDGFLVVQFPHERAKCMKRLRALCGGADIAELCATAARGTLPKYQAPVRSLDLDAGLPRRE